MWCGPLEYLSIALGTSKDLVSVSGPPRPLSSVSSRPQKFQRAIVCRGTEASTGEQVRGRGGCPASLSQPSPSVDRHTSVSPSRGADEVVSAGDQGFSFVPLAVTGDQPHRHYPSLPLPGSCEELGQLCPGDSLARTVLKSVLRWDSPGLYP